MNMSGHYPGQYSQPFGPPNQRNQQQRQQNYRPYREYNHLNPPNYSNSPPRYYPEYNLWGSSSYNRLDPAELIHPGTGDYQQPMAPYPSGEEYDQQESRPPIPPLPAMRSRPEIPPMTEMPPMPVMPPRPQTPPDEITQTEDEAVGGEEPDLTGLEEIEKKTIERAVLFKQLDILEKTDVDFTVDNFENISNSSASSGSSAGDWTHSNFQRAGAYPPSYPWASRPARVVNNRGRKANVMQRRLVKALSQPVKMDKGASMMQRMGWMGGGLGRQENGIVEPVQPNVVYATSTVGFGQIKNTTKTSTSSTTSKETGRVTKKAIKTTKKEIFRGNVLLCLLDFVKDDLVLELYFDTKLFSVERKRIHKIVAALDGRETNPELNEDNVEIVEDIRHYNHYLLSTQSEGEGTGRQICVFKSAPEHMFLVTPDDCRPSITEINEADEEPNPFLKSITKHIRQDEGSILMPKPPHLFDKLIEYFIDFSTDEVFTEFRFLGPFTQKEIHVINNFFNLISDLSSQRKPQYKVPVELLDVFLTDMYCYCTELAPNGFTTIQKIHFDLKQEYERHRVEKEMRRRAMQHPLNHYPLRSHIPKII